MTSIDELRQRIEAAFQRETASAREKRDRALEALEFLAMSYGADQGAITHPITRNAGSGSQTPTPTDGEPSLRVAIKEAIDHLPESGFGKQDIIAYINNRYPKLNAIGRKTSVFTTISRMKDELGIEVASQSQGRNPATFVRKGVAAS